MLAPASNTLVCNQARKVRSLAKNALGSILIAALFVLRICDLVAPPPPPPV